MRRFPPWLWLCLIVASLWGCGASTLPAVRSPAERIQLARQLMAKGNYSTAAQLLKVAVADNPGAAEVDEAIYELGFCYLKLKDWPAAAVEFERLMRDYPESDSSASASFRLGEAYFGQSRPADFDQEFTLRALNQWVQYLRDHPGHWLNAEAEKRIAAARRRIAAKLLTSGRLYLKLGLLEPARIYFGRVESEYGDLDIVADAWLGLAQGDAKRGHKAEAIERLRRIEERFPGSTLARRAARERTRLER